MSRMVMGRIVVQVWRVTVQVWRVAVQVQVERGTHQPLVLHWLAALGYVWPDGDQRWL